MTTCWQGADEGVFVMMGKGLVVLGVMVEMEMETDRMWEAWCDDAVQSIDKIRVGAHDPSI